ncbi:MAG TPA: DUF2946 family protein [Burkholderiales bacterium]|nr:DUF2946 family protein [Burkholderiales bacterium]
MARAMDEAVLRSLAKWPNVPDVYGWLALDRRGNWLLKGERIGNPALRDFISRNYQPDSRGCWYFQNGPQRVFVQLAYAPLVVHLEGEALVDHCGRPFASEQAFLDDEGSMLMQGKTGLALLNDRDLAAFEEQAVRLPKLDRRQAARRFGFVQIPAP